MTAQNRWEDWLGMACASSCWLNPLPVEWVAEVYRLDTFSDADAAAWESRPESRQREAPQAARRWRQWRSAPRAADV